MCTFNGICELLARKWIYIMIIGMIRYAIPNAFLDRDNSRNLIQLYEEPYFSDRFNIFKNITLESFKQQINKDFILLVYHTSLIPDDKKSLFNKIEKTYPFVRNVYISDSNMYVPEDLKGDIMLTFRIDNDDGIALDFIDKLKQIKNSGRVNVAITIPHMHKICRVSENEYKIVELDYISNSMGLAYLSNENKTVMDLGDHSAVFRKFNTIKLDGNGGLQTINDYNVANKFKHNADRNRSDEYLFNYKDAQKFLFERNYSQLDISCLPILK